MGCWLCCVTQITKAVFTPHVLHDARTVREQVGGRGHVLPEEGEPQNRLQERTAQDRARPTGGAATAAREGE